MVQDLPNQDIRLENEITVKPILNTAEVAELGYTVEVDVLVPKELYEILNQTPPCPEARKS
jgi:hypothetical protein